jgi:adenylylsulfate kinase
MEYSGYTLWFTGMSGAGKRTLARYVSKRFSLLGRRWELLEESDLEAWLPEPPDAPREIRDRTTRVLGWMAQLLTRQGVITLVAASSPHRDVRDEQRKRIGRFAEIFVDCPFETLLARDEEGIYRRAMAGELQNVVGVQAPYEPPLQPEVRVDTEKGTLEELGSQIFQRLFDQGILQRWERDVLLGLAPPLSIEAGTVLLEAAKEEEAAPAAKAAKKAAPKPTAAKAAAKPEAKPAAKTAKKAAPKAKPKAPPKAAAKPEAKPAAAKPAARKAAKAAAPKPAPKVPPKAAPKAAPKATAQAAAKPEGKPAAAAGKATKAAAPKPAPKAVAQAAAKPVKKAPSRPRKRGATSGASTASSPG